MRLGVLRMALVLPILAISFPGRIVASCWGDGILRMGLGIDPSCLHDIAEAYPRLVVLEVLIHDSQAPVKVDLVLELSPHISKDVSREVVGNRIKHQEWK